MANKRQALAAAKIALKNTEYIKAKNCTCNFCRAAKRIERQLKTVIQYLTQRTG